jgi:hypothetical protein
MLHALAALSLLLAAPPAEPVVIKLATLAPSGSSWHQRLRELSERWAELSAGQVKLCVYPGCVQGSEGYMLRKIGVGRRGAGALTPRPARGPGRPEAPRRGAGRYWTVSVAADEAWPEALVARHRNCVPLSPATAVGVV